MDEKAEGTVLRPGAEITLRDGTVVRFAATHFGAEGDYKEYWLVKYPDGESETHENSRPMDPEVAMRWLEENFPDEFGERDG